ncbi:hypothetical protein BJV77DRAFT_363602 [Russula vinacea]|nr:hypothetical protein BJV77DRAFT_363602 [Russula vinacea]
MNGELPLGLYNDHDSDSATHFSRCCFLFSPKAHQSESEDLFPCCPQWGRCLISEECNADLRGTLDYEATSHVPVSPHLSTAHYYMRPCCVCFCSDACLNTSTCKGPEANWELGQMYALVALQLDTQPPASARIALQPICPPASRSGIWGFATCYSLTLRVSP